MDMFFVALVRNDFNMVLPARTGELSYVYVLKRKFKFPIEIGVSTLMVVLVFDLVIVFSLILISIIVMLVRKYSSSFLAVIFIASILLVILLLILFYFSKVIGFLLMLGILGFSITGIAWEAVAFSYHIISLTFAVVLGLVSMIILSLPVYRVRE